MLFRLVFGLLLMAGVAAGIAWWRRRSDAALSSGAKKDAIAAHASSEEMQEALELRGKLEALLDRHAGKGAVEAARIARSEIDAIVTQLSDQLDVKRRIETALEDTDETELAHEITEAELDLEKATTDSTKDALTTTIQRLRDQREQLLRLRERRTLLEANIRQINVDLKSLHLALLDALSTDAGLGSAELEKATKSLAAASERIRHQSQAEMEVRQLLRNTAAKSGVKSS